MGVCLFDPHIHTRYTHTLHTHPNPHSCRKHVGTKPKSFRKGSFALPLRRYPFLVVTRTTSYRRQNIGYNVPPSPLVHCSFIYRKTCVQFLKCHLAHEFFPPFWNNKWFLRSNTPAQPFLYWERVVRVNMKGLMFLSQQVFT